MVAKFRNLLKNNSLGWQVTPGFLLNAWWEVYFRFEGIRLRLEGTFNFSQFNIFSEDSCSPCFGSTSIGTPVADSVVDTDTASYYLQFEDTVVLSSLSEGGMSSTFEPDLDYSLPLDFAYGSSDLALCSSRVTNWDRGCGLFSNTFRSINKDLEKAALDANRTLSVTEGTLELPAKRKTPPAKLLSEAKRRLSSVSGGLIPTAVGSYPGSESASTLSAPSQANPVPVFTYFRRRWRQAPLGLD